jgi:alcohol dehydrogenase class IV
MFKIRPVIFEGNLGLESIKKFPLGNNILILSSKTVSKNYGLKELCEGLEKEANVYIFNHISPDAPFSDLDKVIYGLRGIKIDNIIAIGGGSTIDAAKALSIAFEEVSYKDIFYGRQELPKTKIPVLAIPTTAGTGAELSYGAIIYDKENGKKGGIRGEIIQPDYVLIDANLHNGCPPKLKAEVGFDCLTHAIETFISKKSNPIVRNQSINCIRVIFQHLIPACEDNSFKDMEKVAIVSSLMGINLAFSSTCLPHRIQYVIGPKTQTSHAQGLIGIYRGWLRHLAIENVKELSDLALDMGLTVDEFIGKVETLRTNLGIDYGIYHLGIKENDIMDLASAVSGNMQADPSYKDLNSIVNILKLAL